MICIICREEKEQSLFSEEHIIPDSLGGKITIENVCKDCNSKLGSTCDSDLINNLIIDLVRFVYKIKGKSGKKPSPFKSFKRVVLANDESKKIKFKGIKPQIIPKVNQVNNIATISAGSQVEVFKIIKDIFRKNGLENLSEDAIKSKIINIYTSKFKPELRSYTEINIGGIEVGILKIAYEMAYYWLGETYLNDVLGKEIASTILKYSVEHRYNAQYDMYIGKTSEYKPMNGIISRYAPLFGFSDNKIIHVVVLIEFNGQVLCWIRLFNVFERMIKVSNDSSNYKNIRVPFLLFSDPKSGKITEGNLGELLNLY